MIYEHGVVSETDKREGEEEEEKERGKEGERSWVGCLKTCLHALARALTPSARKKILSRRLTYSFGINCVYVCVSMWEGGREGGGERQKER